MKDITVGKNGQVWGINNTNVYSRNGVNGTWERDAAAPECTQISGAEDGRVCCTTIKYEVF